MSLESKSRITQHIPVSISLNPTLQAEKIQPQVVRNKKRLLGISAVAVLTAVCVSFIAKLLIHLIDLFTNIAFYGNVSLSQSSPADNALGLWVIAIPAAGGIIVGLMAFYGSKAIRGHGIPEAMEQILTNQSKIKPAITFLKPLSAAISIGTGGPFGAEGPIIATGGALGSTIGQLLKITHHERKILLAAGATAGMSAIFGSPIAAIFLAIELLLFEFSARSIIPVALACVTGAAGHHLLFDSGPVFPVNSMIDAPEPRALLIYGAIGVLIGLLSALATKVVYFIEDSFEKLPIHWMWWPAMGGVVVGVIGYFAPRTLGVGYNNITDLLSGNLPVQVALALCLLKFASWAVALGSGTSGGTLAPLLTIGGASGMLIGSGILHFFPASGITLPLAAMVGMSAMFAGASRALLTSILFAMETTAQSHALLPLLAACVPSYFVSFFLMENTIMTEKISRRGVKTPHSYEADILEKVTVGRVMKENGLALGENNTVKEVRESLGLERDYSINFFIVASEQGEYKGIISASNLFSHHHPAESVIGTLVKRRRSLVSVNCSLRVAVEMMARENIDVLPVVSEENNNRVVGILSYQDVISAYKLELDEHEQKQPDISLREQGLKILVHGRKLFAEDRKTKS